jgi:uncharacterized SAM-binding protein YcdF (DUF218 family)
MSRRFRHPTPHEPPSATGTSRPAGSPATTKGEAEFVGRLAGKYHWKSVALVTTTPQATRARLRVERCFTGPVYVMTASLPPSAWSYEIAYEWSATVKAVVFQRSC